ncbi:MAG: tRNA (adenosine(37)-N6)-dimethylallyltransferase MiaA [Candidatus Hydrogenedentes bacterium]|nr:tRNA (adenosine(37)-N6)-dimethylallyltransferase MiaA [Candidatus Hydrogenedentota bacterium]
MISILAVVGPTASGKTSLAIELALRLGTEIISADSMQVYKGMEIGTSAPSQADQARVKHHFVSFLEPDQPFSAGDFERQARPMVEFINARNKIAVVTGGSGLYVSALLDGLFDGPPASEPIRRHLHDQADAYGVAPLFERLQKTDPDYAQLIQPNDLRRIVRALEVHELTGQSLSAHHRKHQELRPILPSVQVALDFPREVLYERIAKRVDNMLDSGFIEEVKALLDAGHGPALERLRSLGYREFASYLRGEKSLQEARDAMIMLTRRYAKRQLTWFRADPRIHWLPATENDFPESFVDRVLQIAGLSDA